MQIFEILKKSIIEELDGAKSEENSERYKNALILYSKSMFGVCDYIITINKLKLPDDHRERFEILERYFPFVYRTVNSVFKKYIDTYFKPADKSGCEVIKNAIRELATVEKLDQEIKTIIKKI